MQPGNLAECYHWKTFFSFGALIFGSSGFLDEGEETQKQALDDEKKEREHLLALNQVIARQVMEKSRMVAGMYITIDIT